jgi:hypothetical protein
MEADAWSPTAGYHGAPPRAVGVARGSGGRDRARPQGSLSATVSTPVVVAPVGCGPTARAARRSTAARSLLTWLEGAAVLSRLAVRSLVAPWLHPARRLASGSRLRATHLHGPFRSPRHGLTSPGPEGSRLRALNAPLLPVPVPLPTAPVAFHLGVGDAFMPPFTSLPAVLPVVVPPTGWHPSVEGRGRRAIVGPPAVIAPRSIPTPLPRTPPPAPAEEDVRFDIGNDVDIGFGDHDHLRGRGKNNRWRQRHMDVHADANLRAHGSWNQNRHEQEQRP